MNRKWLWLVIVAVAVAGFVAGVVVAQEEDWDWDIWYLPDYYSESYTPTLAEWTELEFNAYEDRKAWLTDRLQQISCILWVTELGIDVEGLASHVKQLRGNELFVAIEKSYLNREDWEEGMEKLGREGNWDQFEELWNAHTANMIPIVSKIIIFDFAFDFILSSP